MIVGLDVTHPSPGSAEKSTECSQHGCQHQTLDLDSGQHLDIRIQEVRKGDAV